MLVSLSSGPRPAERGLVGLLEECHQRIRHFIRISREVASRRDVADVEVERACSEAIRYFRDAFPLHVADEDESLSPRLRGLAPVVDEALDVLEADHVEHSQRVALLLGALGEVRQRPFDEEARDRLTSIAGPLAHELEKHLALEERVLFPAIRDTISVETEKVILGELRARRGASLARSR